MKIKLNELNINCGPNAYLEIVDEINNSNPLILICPGGGYDHVSTREGLPVGLRFKELGYNTAILNYSVKPYDYRVILEDIDTAVKYLYSLNKDIILLGFSAGGHLAGYYASLNRKIKAVILCYPVISFESFCHEGSKINFLSKDLNENNIKKYSVNNCVNKDYPPTFIWTTKDDQTVPYENTLLMLDSLEKHHIKHSYKLYNHGIHGLSLATLETAGNPPHLYNNKEVQDWPVLVDKFIKSLN